MARILIQGTGGLLCVNTLTDDQYDYWISEDADQLNKYMGSERDSLSEDVPEEAALEPLEELGDIKKQWMVFMGQATLLVKDDNDKTVKKFKLSPDNLDDKGSGYEVEEIYLDEFDAEHAVALFTSVKGDHFEIYIDDAKDFDPELLYVKTLEMGEHVFIVEISYDGNDAEPIDVFVDEDAEIQSVIISNGD